MPEKWTISAHVKKYTSEKFTLWEDKIVPPGDTAEIPFAYLEYPISVVLIAVNEREEYYLVRQYRHPVGEETWEFPAGDANEGETDPQVVGVRELQEEIHFISSNLTRLGQFNSNSSLSTERSTVFLARDLTPSAQERDPTEAGMIVQAFRLEQIEEMVRQGQIHEGSSLAALTYLKLYLAGEGKIGLKAN